jgi:5-methylcytosine-specific restriction endonuclease McrA
MNLRGQNRTEFPQAIRKAAFARSCMPDGVPKCEAPGCGRVIRAGHLIFEHVQPDGLGGEPTMANIAVYCDVCADKKTREDDNPRMAKADRVLKRAYGLGKKRRTIPGRRFNGEPRPARWIGG